MSTAPKPVQQQREEEEARQTRWALASFWWWSDHCEADECALTYGYSGA